MKKFVNVSDASVIRAFLFIIFTVSIPIISMYIYFIKGYSLNDYPNLIKSDREFLFREVIGWLGFSFCFVYGLVPAVKSIKHQKKLINICDTYLFCYGKIICNLNQIQKIKIDQFFFKKNLTVIFNNKKHDCGSIIFCKNSPQNIYNIIKQECDIEKSR
jgi:hypothetical protein